MSKKYALVILLVTTLTMIAGAQEILPSLSDIQYEIQADSLSRANTSQDVSLSITCGSANEIDTYTLKIENAAAQLTVVSAEFNNETIWLINAKSKSNRENVLAWYYYPEENILRLYPSDWQPSYTLNLVVRVNLLRPFAIAKKTLTSVSLQIESITGKFQCATTGKGNRVAFK
jgi:hypothetical protein